MKICDIEIFKPSALSSVVVCYTVVFSYRLCQTLRQYSGNVLNEQSENKTHPTWERGRWRRENAPRVFLFLNHFSYIYIYIHPFSKRFLYREIYRQIYTFVFLHVCLCAFFICYCPTCQKTRFNDKFFLRRVLCSNLKKTCRLSFFRKKHPPCNTNLQWRII